MKPKRWIPMSGGDLHHAFRARRVSKRNAVFTLLGCTAVLGWLYVIFMSQLFIVNEVQAEGLKTLDQLDVTREVLAALDERGEWRPWPKRHALFLDEESLKEKLKTRLFVANVTVDKSHFNILRLKIEERAKRFVLHSRQQYFWIDLQGVATDELSLDEKKHVQARLLGNRSISPDEPPVVKRNLEDVISSGYTVFTADESKQWIQVSDQIVRAGLLYREIEPPGSSSTLLNVLGPEGYDIHMDLTSPIGVQVRTYQAFIKAKPSDIDKVQYIDVRVPGRVYLKER